MGQRFSAARWAGLCGCLAAAQGVGGVSGGCAFIQSAATLTFGEPDVPKVSTQAILEVATLNAAFQQAIVALGVPPAQAALLQPYITMTADSTWNDVRAALCQFDQYTSEPARLAVEIPLSDPASNIKKLSVELMVPGPDGAAYRFGASGGVSCYEQPLRSTAFVEFVTFTAAQAETIKQALNNQDFSDLKDAIVQIRFNFSALYFQAGAFSNKCTSNENCEAGGTCVNGTCVAAPARSNQLLAEFGLIIADPKIGDDPETPYHDGEYALVPHFLLDSIKEDDTQRFELDPDSGVTKAIKASVVDTSTEQMLSVRVAISIAGADLIKVPLDKSGFMLSFQPEIVINALEVISAAL